MKLKINDNVIVTTGKDKGMQGKVVSVHPDENKVVVQGANMYTRHFKPMFGQAGRRERKERAMAASKVAIFNPKTNKADRIGYVFDGDRKVRIYKKTGDKI